MYNIKGKSHWTTNRQIMKDRKLKQVMLREGK
jgi:hypothetical protein